MRIIAGSLRGRELGAVAEGVRPTTDRVRESLFSVLGSVEGLRVLDLFAGTGALGLEARSRGASAVVWVEQSRRVAAELTARIARLGLDRDPELQVIVSEAARAIGRLEADRPARAFDLVFFDPPYDAPERVPRLELLFSSRLLAPNATVVVEGSKRHPLPAVAGARVEDERRYGETVLTWLVPVGREGGG